MEQEKLQQILTDHKKWHNNEGGKRADLRNADLCGADFYGADLSSADLRNADLCGADLRNADLCGANLRNADLDCSCLPLWCGSLTANFDDRQIIQLAYHVVKAGIHSENVSKEVKAELAKLTNLVNKFHRVEECEKFLLRAHTT